MTALDFVIQDDAVVVAMDTLSLRAVDHKPYKMVTKFMPIPHMNSLICGTGNMGAVIDWFSWVEKNVIANGIYQLDRITRQVIKEFMQEHNGDNLCTIYQFGLHELDGKFHGYAYRSTDDFEGEEIHGLRVKPPDAFLSPDGTVDLSPYAPEGATIQEILKNIMHRQKEYDDSLNVEDRLGIGGIIQIVILSKDRIVIENYEYFDDFESTHIEMLKNLDG